MPPAPPRVATGPLAPLCRGFALRCPRCGAGRLFRTWFRMHDGCPTCGLSFVREPGFYLGSIYINYGVTVIVTGAAYAAAVLVAGLSSRTALVGCLGLAVLLPILFFPFARSLLLALDTGVNREQAAPADPGLLDAARLRSLTDDDGRAGCAMGVALALVILFGLGMAVVTLLYTAAPPADLETLGDGPAPLA